MIQNNDSRQLVLPFEELTVRSAVAIPSSPDTMPGLPDFDTDPQLSLFSDDDSD